MKNMRSLLAEFIGTFFLCFAGIAAILCNQPPINAGSGLIGVALAHGLALSVAVNAFGGISGAHFNPAVTIGMLATGRINAPLAGCYIVSQLIAAAVSALACVVIFPVESVEAAKLGIPLPPAQFADQIVVLLVTEFILTFLLMTAIYGTAIDDRGQAVKIGGFGIGLAVTFDILAGGPISGASMNPARSFGPAIVYSILVPSAEGGFHLHWLYWVAPILGAVAAALVYHHLLLDRNAKR
jgi:MIP family channel proteins